MDIFALDSIVNAVFMDTNHRDNIKHHSDRPSHGFVYFKRGDTKYTFKSGKSFTAVDGSFVYLPKDSTYSFEYPLGIHGEVYCINLLCNDNVFGDGEADEKAFVLKLKRTLQIESLYKKVIREMYLKRPYYELTVKALVYEICAIVLSEKHSEYSPQSLGVKLMPAISYIDEHYIDNDLKIPNLAEMCEMSECYFRRQFKKHFGMSPVSYINMRKISYAEDFLKSGLYSVSDVASLAGFYDTAYFSKTYKKIMGETPSKYVNK